MNKTAIVIAALIIVPTILIIHQDEKSKVNMNLEKTVEKTTNPKNQDTSTNKKAIEPSNVQNEKSESQAQTTPGKDAQGNEMEDENQEYVKPACNLVRPGNIQYVECNANYIKKEKISLIISNNLGESIIARLRINNCDTEKQSTINNNEQKEFIFYCTPENYFEEDLYIIYEIQDKNIEVFGVVLGSVS